MSATSNVRLTVIGLAMGLLLAALDQTIVSTAMPTIISKLGGLDYFVWVYSSYLIANVVSMPIFGRLSDMYGRKLFFLLGITVFMAGSALCGTSGNMTQLIVYRAIQGIGGGALMPITFAIIFDLFPPEKRGKMQGLFGAVFGLSSVFGPIAGAYFTDHWTWNWIFYINLPLGVVSFFLIAMAYKEGVERRKQKIDWFGTVTMMGAVLLLMFALEFGGKTVGGVNFEWSSVSELSLFAGSIVFLALFLWIETKVESPIIPLGLFKNRLFTSSMGASFFYGVLLLAAASYIPLFIQGVYEGSATNAGIVMTPMMLGVVVSSTLGGRFIGKTSYRNIMLVSAVLVLLSSLLLSGISVNTSRTLVTFYMVLMGLGVGASFPVISVSALHKIEFRERGIVTSLVSFFRTIGSAVGIIILGTVQSSYLKSKLSKLAPNPRFENLNANALLQPEVRKMIPKEILDQITAALADSIAHVFVWSLVMAVAALLFILFMGKAKEQLPAKAAERKTVGAKQGV